jgi:hypothetical protein
VNLDDKINATNGEKLPATFSGGPKVAANAMQYTTGVERIQHLILLWYSESSSAELYPAVRKFLA